MLCLKLGFIQKDNRSEASFIQQIYVCMTSNQFLDIRKSVKRSKAEAYNLNRYALNVRS